jgi:threonine dehydrogenase-like Zn-dependent dehydrogenase
MAIALGRLFGLHVIVTCGTDEKCAAALDLGAEAAINYRTQDFVEAAARLTDGKGVNVVLDMVGGDYLPRNLAALAEEGATGARDRPGPAGAASTALLDTEVLTVSGHGMRVALSLRMVFALSGMGFAPAVPGEVVRISATDSWARIDARYGAVVRRRHALLPLLM